MIPMHPPRITMISNVTGGAVKQEITKAAYWARHVREAVRFSDGMKTLQQMGVNTLVEVGPHPTLLGLAAACWGSHPHHLLPSQRKDRPGWEVMLESLGHLWTHGARVNWADFNRPYTQRKVVLPTYPWQRGRYWVERPLGIRSPSSSADLGRVSEPVQSQLYTLDWQIQPLPQARRPTPDAGTWLVLLDEQGLGEAIAKELEAAGAACLRLPRPSRGETAADELLTAESVSALSSILAQHAAAAPPLRGVVSLWSYDDTCSAKSTNSYRADSCIRSLRSVLNVLKALVKSRSAGPLPLWLVTRGAVSVGPGGGLVAVEQAGLWGLLRVMSLEQPQLFGGLVDLQAAVPESLIPALAAQERGRRSGSVAPRRSLCTAARITSFNGSLS
jgi:acyl transferase domain-containing protein